MRINYEHFEFDNPNYEVIEIKTKMEKQNGKWREIRSETSTIPHRNYTMFVQSIPFRNGFLGATSRVLARENIDGQIVVSKEEAISPDKQIKYITTFEFISKI